MLLRFFTRPALAAVPALLVGTAAFNTVLPTDLGSGIAALVTYTAALQFLWASAGKVRPSQPIAHESEKSQPPAIPAAGSGVKPRKAPLSARLEHGPIISAFVDYGFSFADAHRAVSQAVREGHIGEAEITGRAIEILR